MQNNSNNSNHGWRQRLDEFEDVTGNNLQLNTAWEKLQQKQDTNHPSYSKKWVWLAAACLTGLVITFATFSKKVTNETILPGLVSNQQKNEVENIILIENTPLSKELNKQQVTPTKKTSLKPVKLSISNASPEQLLVVNETITPIPVVITMDTNATRPSPTIAVVKKLKLVHINEINQPQQGIAKEEGKPYFPITHPTKQVYTNNVPTNKKDRDNIIRIKIN